MDRVTWSRISSWTLGISVSFWRRSRPMLLHPECADVPDVGANTSYSQWSCASHRPALLTRRFEAQLHWQPVVQLPLHSTRAASRPPALRLGQIQAVFSLGAPCRTGASRISVQRGTCTTYC